MLSNEALDVLVRLGTQEGEPLGQQEVELLRNERVFQGVRREQWRRVLSRLERQEVEALIRGLVIAAERHRLGLGSTSPVVSLFPEYMAKWPDWLEMAAWVMKESTNPRLPFPRGDARSLGEYAEGMEAWRLGRVRQHKEKYLSWLRRAMRTQAGALRRREQRERARSRRLHLDQLANLTFRERLAAMLADTENDWSYYPPDLLMDDLDAARNLAPEVVQGIKERIGRDRRWQRWFRACFV